MLFRSLASFPTEMPSGDATASVVVLGVVCTAFAFLIFFRLIAEIGPSRATIITYVNPVVALALGVAVLGEQVTTGAVAVADFWHNRGVATALLARLTERAREEGVRRFSAEILADNAPMLDLIEDLGDVTARRLDQGSVEVEVELPPEGLGATLRATLRAAARELGAQFAPMRRAGRR